MSRIGKTPVLIPEKVSVDFNGLTVTVKGPKGELKRLMPEGVSFDKKDNTVVVSPTTTKIYSRQRHGLCRALIANMVEGVTQGFSKKLEIVGNEAAKIRSIRPPEPYKGKGIKYHDERILRKAGKSGKK